jgi:hypothetical protein
MIHIWTTDDFYQVADGLARWQFYAARHGRRDLSDQYGAAWRVVMDLWEASLTGAAYLPTDLEDEIMQAVGAARKPRLTQLAAAASMVRP